MDLTNLRNTAASYYRNLRGWRTNRKIVVIESDDWGSIRMPSREVYKRCLKAGYRVDQNPYERYDSLASEDDLELLFDLLTKFKDSKGNHPVITANCLTANPDFEKIREDGFQKYHYESIKATFAKYPRHQKCFQLWLKGMERGIFRPQSHGREHLNVSKWMESLRVKDKDTHFGFENQMPGCIPHGVDKGKNRYVQATKYSSKVDKEDKLNIVIEGLASFKKLLGYKSDSYIPTNYIWSPDFNPAIKANGVKFLQGRQKLIEPQIDGTNKIFKQSIGIKNEAGVIPLSRNCMFEPSATTFREKCLDAVMSEISTAFTMKKPAVISMHRINFVGYIDESNRDQNLRLFDNLLQILLKKWPDIEFMSTEKMGKLILENQT